MPLLKQLRTKADQVTLEADKALRINRKQSEIGQTRKQIDQQSAHLGALAYALHKQGQVFAPDLQAVCQQIDGLFVLIQQAELDIDLIRREALPGEQPVSGIVVPCAALSFPRRRSFVLHVAAHVPGQSLLFPALPAATACRPMPVSAPIAASRSFHRRHCLSPRRLPS